ncbi:cupin domain-containing protein [Congregibacter variabilis]|uniref:Cupin domain-containing protein n=1 Tax=Congregibacter variabilis TaxID=3081200 RepID=A0ABZ0I3U2_9GAMM|nr:cupin domain-containing protein [Congregibacter sp. IMCC43200]
MNLFPSKKIAAISLLASLMAAPLQSVSAQDVVHPAEMSTADIAGAIFDRPDTLVKGEGADTVKDITSLMSSDGRFASGMYLAGKSRWVIEEPYGVDEFMYFLEGGVTLTSSDGSVTTITAGEAVTIPKEWTGIWETEGYKKIWVIYSDDGSAFE